MNKLTTADFRSDTFTRPTPQMLEFMMAAEVGDDVFGEDPTVNQLEAMVADMFGMEAALFCPTGTMSNQVAIKAHTQPGDEVICDRTAHVYQYEGGGIAFNSGAQVRLLEGDRGRITATQAEAAINPDDVHKARTSLICLENTSNRGGGSCYELDEIRKLRELCDHHELKLHLDGARLFNALVAKKHEASSYGHLFHSISVCFNKGMGCPIGSVLIGTRDFIKKSRRVRKVFGGGMRQAGYMAAAAIFALGNHIARLEEDHAHARHIAKALKTRDCVGEILPVETNIIIFELKEKYSAAQFCEALKQEDILALPVSKNQVRMVLHLGITPAMVERTIAVITSL